VAKIAVTDVAGRTALDVTHPTLTTVPSSATAAEVAAYFATSSSRRLAAVADGDRYVGAIDAETFDPEAGATAADLVHPHPTVAPDAPAELARDLALGTESRRVPVVDAGGRLLGVVAIDKTRTGFCGSDDSG
jgi:CBS domain-containing protein